MTLKHLAITIALATALPCCAAAQQNFHTLAADSILKHIDKTPITSGYWYDRAFCLSRLDLFDNNRDTSTWEYAMQAYDELYQAALHPGRMTAPEVLNRYTRYLNAQGKIPIQVLDYTYQQLKPTAVQEGLLNYNSTTGIITNTPGSPNPFITKRLRLATPLVQVMKSNTVTLLLLPNFISRNTGLNVVKVEVSGPGFFKTLQAPADSVAVSFPTMGSHIITLTTYMSNGSHFTTKSEVVLGDNINNPGSKTQRPDGTTIEPAPACRKQQFVGNIPWQGYTETRPLVGKFDLSIYYRTNDPSIICAGGAEQPLKKPVILIDGYDPTDKRNASNDELYRKFLRYIDDVNDPNNPVERDFVLQIRTLGFDVILVDIPTYFYTNNGQVIPLDSNAQQGPPGMMGDLIHGGGDYIERNARTMVALLQYIQSKIGPTDSIVLIGPSMGGQITRYALKYMEDRGLPHKVRLWISQDSNHEGAIVPLGEQMLIAELAKAVNTLKISRDQQLLSPANKQFVINHFKYNDSLNTEQVGGAPGFQNRYQHVIDSIGWPQLCRKISTISGAENGSKLNVPDAGQLALRVRARVGDIDLGTSFWEVLGNLIFGGPCNMYSSTNCHLGEFSMFTAPAPGQRSMVMEIKLRPVMQNLLGKLGIVIPNTQKFAIGDTRFTNSQSVEVIQSGYYWAYKELTEQLGSFKMPDFVKKAMSMVTVQMPAGYNPIQPTGSTLAYRKGSNPNVYLGYHPKWDDDVTGFNLSCDKYIPFDAYMGPKVFSVLHDSIFYPQAQVLISEIQGIIPEYPKPHKYVFLRKTDVTKHYFCPGETLSFYAETNFYNPAALNLRWTVNSNKFVIVSGQGTPTVSIQYLGGMTFDEYQALGSIKISVAEESPCYRLSAAQPIEMGVGDIWSGTMTGTFANYGWPLSFAPGYNMSDRANVKIVAALTFKETWLQNYTLTQNTYGTPMTWSITTQTQHNVPYNQLNITSAQLGEYYFKVSDSNRCFAKNNSFVINFGRNLLFRTAPNPASTEVTIFKTVPAGAAETGKPAFVRISIFNLYSKLPLFTQSFVNNADVFKIPVRYLPDGEYLLQVQYGNDVYNEKIFVRK